MARIIKLECIGEPYSSKLIAFGIRTTERLLAFAAHPEGRIDLTEATGISKQLILDWVNIADLMRVKGIGEEYSDLLDQAGINTIGKLQAQKPDTLRRSLIEINAANQIVRRIPSKTEVIQWVKSAKDLSTRVT